MELIYKFVFTCIELLCKYCRWINRHKYPVVVMVGVVLSLVLTALISLVFLQVSRHNYPGGHAFSHLHCMVDDRIELKLGKLELL